MLVYKMTGSGNDFVMLDGRTTRPADWRVERIRAVCDRRTGVGADGLVILTPEGPESIRMTYFNADGSRAAMCGNAALCSTRLATRLGMVPLAGMELRTDAGDLRTRCIGDGDMAEISLSPFPLPVPVPAIAAAPGEEPAWLATVGVPHLVILTDDVTLVDVAGRGRLLRSHPALGAAGANVNWVSPPVDGRWRIRTFERGVEGETLACGTGTVAAAVTLAALGRAVFPVNFLSWGGQPLSVRARLADGAARDVWLAGQGRLVFTATLA